MKVISHDKNIDLLSNMVLGKVENLSSYMCCNLQSNSCNDILKNIMGCSTFIFTQASKQVNTQNINDMFTLITWKMFNKKIWQAETDI